MSNSKVVFISPCPTRSGSTFLYNAICGFVNPTLSSIVCDIPDKVVKMSNHLDVVKSHNLKTAQWNKVLKSKNITPYFISSQRLAINKRMPVSGLKSHIIFQYDELLETPKYPLSDIVDHMYGRLRKLLPDDISMDKDSCLNRLTNMNLLVKEIADKPFSYVDPFYEIHGGHRNRRN